MAPRGPAKARDYDYSNVGKAGRRTGITLKEGKRDEHGMEEIEGMFSSPEKSPVKYNGFGNANETIIGSEGMSMDEGNGPGPADFLGGAHGRRGSYFPPPVARSPMKTGLTGSPRRTPGLRSSPNPHSEPASSSPSSGRQKNDKAKIGKAASRNGRSPLSHRRTNAPSPHTNGVISKAKGKEVVPEHDITAEFSDDDANGLLNGDENGGDLTEVQDDFSEDFNAGDDSDRSGDDRAAREEDHPEPEDNEQDVSEAESPSIIASGSRRAKQGKTASSTQRNPPTEEAKRTTNQNGNDAPKSAQKRKRPGRPPKAQRDSAEETDEQRPSKKAKTSEQKPKPSTSSSNPELDKFVENYTNRTGPLKGRSLYILKRETPSDERTTHTRSGRVSVRPLAYWRNERCVYGDGGADVGERFPLSTIKEIIRTEEIEPERRRIGKRKSSSKKAKSKRNKDDESEDEDGDHADPWEKEGGVLHGYVRKWDAEAQTGTDEEEVLDIAYAPSGIETRDVKDSTFRFAKLLSSPFLGSGVVELPPGGVKKPKNSKKMHMVFYVCHGRVQVDISGVQFSAGKGCVFQVPRGNYYSFANTYDKDARLFFTQGCVPVEPDGSAAASKPAVAERESTTEGSRTTGGTKGRPRGKQKGGNESKQ
ncbi:hypothetical protein VTN02DRAFT_1546 [Thermoascus thermophilus]